AIASAVVRSVSAFIVRSASMKPTIPHIRTILCSPTRSAAGARGTAPSNRPEVSVSFHNMAEIKSGQHSCQRFELSNRTETTSSVTTARVDALAVAPGTTLRSGVAKAGKLMVNATTDWQLARLAKHEQSSRVRGIVGSALSILVTGFKFIRY